MIQNLLLEKFWKCRYYIFIFKFKAFKKHGQIKNTKSWILLEYYVLPVLFIVMLFIGLLLFLISLFAILISLSYLTTLVLEIIFKSNDDVVNKLFSFIITIFGLIGPFINFLTSVFKKNTKNENIEIKLNCSIIIKYLIELLKGKNILKINNKQLCDIILNCPSQILNVFNMIQQTVLFRYKEEYVYLDINEQKLDKKEIQEKVKAYIAELKNKKESFLYEEIFFLISFIRECIFKNDKTNDEIIINLIANSLLESKTND